MTDKPISLWITFAVIFVVLIILDLGVLNKKDEEISIKKSLYMSLFYFLVSIAFGFYVLFAVGTKEGADFFTGYLVEKSLSLDNIFVISMVFGSLAIPRKYQHRVLFWGILGAVVMRGIMIALGVELIAKFHFILCFFGAFLVFTGIKMLFAKDEAEKNIEESKVYKLVTKFIPVTEKLHGNKFWVKQGGKKIATPLFLALIMVELVDVVFAVDSVPAILAITTDPFVVYTSNIFAILGLRSLYFALAAILHRFHYLKYSLSLVLVFIGTKIFLLDVFKIPSLISLTVTASLLIGGVLFSLYKTKEAK
jgi:tellurite resistance protein TerC